MKITAGLGSIDDYMDYVHAGAGELFCGYIPAWWTDRYANLAPLNRREVVYYNVQIGSSSELQILHDMVQSAHVPVAIAVNAPFYLPEQYALIERYIHECMDLGFGTFIIADPALLIYLRQCSLSDQIRIHLSGECSEINPIFLHHIADLQIDRIIFHRKMTIAEIAQCIDVCKDTPIHEFEAFALNENCHFHGAYCQSLHCDELSHICHLPYRAVADNGSVLPNITDAYTEDTIVGNTGCGICALWDLRCAGITHLKIVGRGNYADGMKKDIRAMADALSVLSVSSSREAYIQSVKKQLFQDHCSGNCYYPSISSGSEDRLQIHI